MSDQTQNGAEAPKKVQIQKSVLAAQVEAGMKKVDLMEFYGLKEAQMTRVLQAAGLRIRKFHTPVYELVDDTEEVVEEVVADTPVEEAPAVTEEVQQVENVAPVPTEEVTAVEETVVEEEVQHVEAAEDSAELWK